ncbi:probable glutamate receptor [Pristis pectinata]|uniref:probable glutamate receptor n=1 Tax=Pristis pectinata TaxID=685728 RepID=UPI00223CDD88|nr:probable glutamate receptor [Pristis pectinata]XP_051895467.1 probable glutamate receptor [Pristis pectinata]
MKLLLSLVLLLPFSTVNTGAVESHDIPPEAPEREKRQLSQQQLMVTTILQEPFIMVKATGGYEGFCIDLLQLFSERLNFSYDIQLVKDGFYGTKLENGQWTGLLGELMRKEADVAIAPLTITRLRESEFDFTRPFMSVGISILVRKDTNSQSTGLFQFLSPFSPETWFSLLFAYIMTCFCMFLAARLSPSEWSEPEVESNRFSLLDSFWFGIGALALQGVGPHPRALSTRTIGMVWWLFVIIFLVTYATNFGASLNSENQRPIIKSFNDLAKQNEIEYGTVHGGSTFQFFKQSKIPVYHKIYSTMNSKIDSVLVGTMNEGTERVLASNYALIGESATIDLAAARDCNLMRVPDVAAVRGYGIATRRGDSLRNNLSLAILELEESGHLHQLKAKWWRSSCNEGENSGQWSPLKVNQIGGALLLLAIGLSLALVIACIELAIKSRKKADQDKSCCNVFTEEINLRFKGRNEVGKKTKA